MANEKKTANAAEVMDWQDLLAAAEQQGRAIETGEFFKFKNHGDFAVGKLVEIQEPRGKMKSPVAVLLTDENVMRPLGISGNLEGMISPSLRDHFISVWYVGDKDVGQPQPMKVYRVIDHGNGYPAVLRGKSV